MTLAIHLTAAALILTKFFDCLTTHRRLPSIDAELNPLARKVMLRLGPRATIWMAFAVTVVIVAVVWWPVLRVVRDGAGPIALLYGSAFVLLGLAISVIQGAVAWTNHTGRMNRITARLAAIFTRGGR